MVKVKKGIVSLEFEDGSTLSVGDRMEKGIVIGIERCKDELKEGLYKIGLWNDKDGYLLEYVDGWDGRWTTVLDIINN